LACLQVATSIMAQVHEVAVKADADDKELLKRPQTELLPKLSFGMMTVVFFLSIVSVSLNAVYLADHQMRRSTVEDVDGPSYVMTDAGGHPVSTRELIVSKTAQELVDGHAIDLSSLKSVSINTASGDTLVLNVLGAHRFNATKVDLFLTFDYLLRVQGGSYLVARVNPQSVNILDLSDAELLALAEAQGLSSAASGNRRKLFWSGDANVGNNVGGNQNNHIGGGGGQQCNGWFTSCTVNINHGSPGAGSWF